MVERADSFVRRVCRGDGCPAGRSPLGRWPELGGGGGGSWQRRAAARRPWARRMRAVGGQAGQGAEAAAKQRADQQHPAICWQQPRRAPQQRRHPPRQPAHGATLPRPGACPGRGPLPTASYRWKVPVPAQPRRPRAHRESAGTGAAAAGQRAAHPPSAPPPGHGRPAGSRSGTACPTSDRYPWQSRSHAATVTA